LALCSASALMPRKNAMKSYLLLAENTRHG
jgi:hypothetical protein